MSFDIRSPSYQDVLLRCWRQGRTPSLVGALLEFNKTNQEIEAGIEARVEWARERDRRAARGKDVSDESFYNRY
jgi:hypothetical protein